MVSILLFTISACYQGKPSEEPPIHINPNMDTQPKYGAQEESDFFENGATMRMPVPGTVARGELAEDAPFYFGKDQSGELIDGIPVPVTMHLLERGQERYDIYCAPCHSRVGDGRGVVVQRGYPPPPSFHEDYVREYSEGHIFDVISNGIRNMPGYKHQIPVNDRWAIVAYFRALQRSQNATIDDVPVELRDEIK